MGSAGGEDDKDSGINTHFIDPVTEEEEKSLPEKIRMVSDLVAAKRRTE